jgi:peptidoglycan/LPS O-acetylase OafA/YrhL
LIDAGVLWTLRVEAQFYLLLPFLAWFAKGKRIFLLLSATLLLYFLCRNLPTESWSHYTFTVFLKLSLVGFGFGIFTAYCERSARILSWLQSNRFTVIAVAALIALFFIQPDGYSFTESALLWLPFASIAAGGIFAKLLRGPITLFLGGISYSYYLIHGLILFLFSRAIDHQTAFAKLTGGQFFFFVFSSYFLSVAVASVIFRWVEYPFLSDSRAAKN